MNLADVLDNEILPRVEKPSRYLGNEVNASVKPAGEVEVRIALAFPDLYDLGLGNLGIHILYTCLNQLPWASCERAYAPGIDLEAQLRQRDLKLFALESKDELRDFDGLGFTLQSELTYTNILNMIDMAGIPLRSVDRQDSDTIVFAGGPAVFNPEPLAPFIDAFVIGDGEDAIIEIVTVLRELRGARRKTKLLALSQLEGVYVPALYPMDELPDGRILPREDAPKIRKRITRDLDGATFPVDYIVPFTQQVHDRISLEVLRGCTQGCRFCQAGMVTRPVRERQLSRVDELLTKTLATTGYEEVSLVSLSTCDHSRVRQLVENTVETLRDQHVSISLPSLRLDSFSVDLADMVAENRRTGLTVAPEAASPRLRALINKWIPDEDLLDMADRAFELQWSHVKLYFMIGLPTERDDDIEAIADLAQRTLAVGKARNGRARVNLGVSTFVPKPFTPFQWAPQISFEEVHRRQDVLAAKLTERDVKFGRHHPEETFIEGMISRSDRRGADLLEAAWREGARFDGWSEHLDHGAWRRAIEAIGWDVEYALRERGLDERLPWDHIDVLIPKSWFQEDWRKALELKHAEDCRHKRCHKCGVIDVERELCATMLRDHVEGRKTEAAWTRSREVVATEAPAVVQRLWIRFARTGKARFLSHLEAMNAWVRAMRRAKVPLAYSQGFHPHPKVAFSSAVPTGEETVGDYVDIELTGLEDPALLLTRLQGVMPDGFEVLEVMEVSSKAPSLMGLNQGGVFKLRFPREDRAHIEARVSELAASESIVVRRRGKARNGRGKKRQHVWRELDVRPMLADIRFEHDAPLPSVHVVVHEHEGRPGKASDLVKLIATVPELARIVRVDTLRRQGEGFVPMMDELPGNWLPADVAAVAK